MAILPRANSYIKSFFIPMDVARTPLTKLSQSELNKCTCSYFVYGKFKPEFPKFIAKNSMLSSDGDTLIENIIKLLRSNPKIRECFGLQRSAVNIVEGGAKEGYRLIYKAQQIN